MTRPRTAHIPGQTALISRADAGMAPEQVQAARERIDWEQAAETAILAYAVATTSPWTSFDVAKARKISEPVHHNHWGLLLARLHRDGLIEPAGWDQSHRPSSGRSGVRTWRYTGGSDLS